MLKQFTLYRADCTQKAYNADYPHKETITSLEDLLRTAEKDHIFSEMADNHRGTDNYLSADGIILDLDNTFTDDPNEWKTIGDITDAFPEVMFYYVESRNHMKLKTKTNSKGVVTYEEPRPKYHLYFPLSHKITDHEQISRFMLEAAGLYCYMDLASAEPQHFFFGVNNAQGGEVEGPLTIDEYVASCGAELRQMIADNLNDYERNIKAGLYKTNNETQKAIARLNTLIGRTTTATAPTQPQEAESVDEPIAWIENAELNRRLQWLEGWADQNGVALGKRYKVNTKAHPNALAICVTCPWEDEHSMNGAENESVILIDTDGRLNYLCRHSHGAALTWTEYRKKIEDTNGTAKRIQEGYESHIGQANAQTQEDRKAEYLKTSTAGYIDLFKKHVEESKNTPSQPTGFSALDKQLDGGLKMGLYFLGAVSSLGKTTFALQIADNVAAAGRDVLIFSLEMGKDELIAKSISRLTYINASIKTDAKAVNDILEGARYDDYSDAERALIDRAFTEYRQYGNHVYIYEGVGDISVKQIRETVKNHIDMTGNKPVVFVDYLQILAPYNERFSDKQNTDRAVTELRRLARDYRIPVLAISSFNRASYGSGSDGHIGMSDYKESGAIEYGADVLIGLEFASAGQDFDEKAAKRQNPREIRLVLLKNRSFEPWTDTTFKYYQKYNYFVEAPMSKPNTWHSAYDTKDDTNNDFKPLGTQNNGKREKKRKLLESAFMQAQVNADTVGEPVTLYALAEILDMSQASVKNMIRELGGYSVEKDGQVQVTGEVDMNTTVRMFSGMAPK